MTRLALQRLSKIALLVGFAALLVANLTALASPARGYELSLYQSSPLTFWVATVVALAVAVAVALSQATRRATHAAYLLAVTAVASVVVLPLTRDYYFYGAGDSLSHLGWTREIAAGSLSPIDLLYPGVHTMSLVFGEVAGISFRRSILFFVLFVFFLLFVLFVPLCVQLVARDAVWSPMVGLFAALLYLPVNDVSVHPHAHPASQAILFLPFILFLLFRYTTQPPMALTRRDRATSFGILLALASSSIVLIHPQQALNLVFVLLAVTGVQLVASRYRPRSRIAAHRPLITQTVMLLVVFAIWAPRHERVSGATVSIFTSLLSVGPTAGETVGQKSLSLTLLGGSVLELFFKLFFVSLVFSILAGIVMLALLTSRLDGWPADRKAILVYLTVSLVPLFGAFTVFFLSSSGDMYFRYLGFIMVPVTILGAVGLSDGATWLSRHVSWRTGGVAVGLVLAVLLPLALVTVHPSPYIYQPSPQVPASQLGGHQTAFEHRDPGVEFTGIRGGPRRYVDAHYGTQHARMTLDFPGYEDGVPAPVFNRANYTSYYDETRYLGITGSGRTTETRLYGGFRYSDQGYRELSSTPGVSRVVSNDGFHLYVIDGAREQ